MWIAFHFTVKSFKILPGLYVCFTVVLFFLIWSCVFRRSDLEVFLNVNQSNKHRNATVQNRAISNTMMILSIWKLKHFEKTKRSSEHCKRLGRLPHWFMSFVSFLVRENSACMLMKEVTSSEKNHKQIHHGKG